ncbi:MAG: hypothetical protein NT133_17385 [Alphaproteobacteria bacterium]|nr:hypothetical protein [Alphaproteobacteria bacterium]
MLKPRERPFSAKSRCVIGALVGALSLGLGSSANAIPGYNLRFYDENGTTSVGVTADSQIVGMGQQTSINGGRNFISTPEGINVIDGGINGFYQATNVSDNGKVTGFQVMSAGPSGSGGYSRGYTYINGSYSYFDAPNAYNTTRPEGINNAGQVVGFSVDVELHAHGFLLTGNVFTSLDVPGATDTYAMSINSSGDIVGYFRDAGGQNHGFLRTSSGLINLDVPGATNTTIVDINDDGQITGQYQDISGSLRGFRYASGAYYSIDGIGSVNYTEPESIGSDGQIVGYYFDAIGYRHGFVNTLGATTTLDVPGASETILTDISPSGVISGHYAGNSGYTIAFLATPVAVAAPEPRSSVMLASALAILLLFARNRHGHVFLPKVTASIWQTTAHSLRVRC